MTAKFGKDRFPYGYQNAVGQYAGNQNLHANSIELANILIDNNILTPESKIYEMGAGGCRNLYYIYKTLENHNTENLELYANDLFKESSFNNMHEDIQKIINFYEGDSEDIANQNVTSNLDLFLVSDHFMHLQYEKADNIIKKVLSDWKPKHIMLRELKKEHETPDHPRLYHDYHQILNDYEMVVETTSEQDHAYFIWLLKRK